MLKITSEQLKTLKENAMNSRDGNDGSVVRCSTYEILTAHIWRCVTKAPRLVGEQPTMLQISVDGRSRLNNPPTYPPRYFGNVIFHATPIALAGDLISEPMIKTVGRIQQAIKRMDEEYLRSAIDYLEDRANPKEGIIQVPGACQSPNLKLVSWMRLPLKTADFGWGKPTSIRQVNLAEGKGHILPQNADGSLSLTIGLDEDAMEAFKTLFYDY
ncbi:Shikimate O-hydroxycinnamoyltransferase [Linum perenne]